jgi:hypothetical protein
MEPDPKRARSAVADTSDAPVALPSHHGLLDDLASLDQSSLTQRLSTLRHRARRVGIECEGQLNLVDTTTFSNHIMALHQQTEVRGRKMAPSLFLIRCWFSWLNRARPCTQKTHPFLPVSVTLDHNSQLMLCLCCSSLHMVPKCGGQSPLQ